MTGAEIRRLKLQIRDVAAELWRIPRRRVRVYCDNPGGGYWEAAVIVLDVEGDPARNDDCAFGDGESKDEALLALYKEIREEAKEWINKLAGLLHAIDNENSAASNATSSASSPRSGKCRSRRSSCAGARGAGGSPGSSRSGRPRSA